MEDFVSDFDEERTSSLSAFREAPLLLTDDYFSEENNKNYLVSQLHIMVTEKIISTKITAIN